MSLKKLVAAAALGVALGAQAQTAHLPGEAPFALDNSTAVIVGLQFQTDPAAGITQFLDLFPFTIASQSTVAGVFLLPGVLSSLIPAEAAPLLSTPLLFSIVDLGANGATVAVDNLDDQLLSLQTILNPGLYAFAVTGASTPPLNLYAALVAAAPVPEPETYALALSGLGLVGWMARRRKKI
jgi:hypothetical protein